MNRSEFLVLLASPAAARSEWVRRETAYWCEHKAPGTILIVHTAGGIVWDQQRDDFDWSRTTALPSSLEKVFAEEPRLVDLSWARDIESGSLAHPQFRDCIADLAAPMHRRPKEELFSEDARQHRRTRRLVRGAVAVLTIMATVAAVAAFVAFDQRDVARARARVSASRALAAEAVANQPQRLDRALLLAIEALRTEEARSALLGSLEQAPQLLGYFRGESGVNSVNLSPDGGRLVSGEEDGSVVSRDVDRRDQDGVRVLGHRARVEGRLQPRRQAGCVGRRR